MPMPLPVSLRRRPVGGASCSISAGEGEPAEYSSCPGMMRPHDAEEEKEAEEAVGAGGGGEA